MTAIAFTFFTNCNGQAAGRGASSPRSDIFMDLGSMIYLNTANISIGHQFGRSWSAYSCAYIRMSHIPADTQSEEYIHHAETDPEYGIATEAERGCNAIEAGIRYWPVKAYEGIYISLGYQSSLTARSACTIGTGIYIPIWDGITAEIAYTKTIYNIERTSDKLRVGIGYIF